ncbi:aminotransferase class V-fold PLP-dependent enzyme [Streptomyces sp. ODS05-4]|uniref:pyridoxal phosphate-dependent decarboxylase family protein n=1 Tax=Streptomyces sp. ODS05-4 TaxID=2944939 RepID=UPI002108C854|nr:aminotransferase class V-fold PLP-dependent enzyme [Streptomyces sp. ODS05-4]
MAGVDGVDPAGLAGGVGGADALGPLADVVLEALRAGAERRDGPLPAGGPDGVERRFAGLEVLPGKGVGAERALRELVGMVAEGAADPADPGCVAHLHCPPLAVAVAADLAASALNPSMDSWDQAPAATALEEAVTRELAGLVYPAAGAADALITSGGTESNLVALLLAREQARGGDPLRVVCGRTAHHSVARAAWLLGLPEPVAVACPGGRMDPQAVRHALAALPGGVPTLVVATAGTTDEGIVDPLPALADAAAAHGAMLHVDAAYGGPLLFSGKLAPRLAGIERADSVTFDLHKLGWQPVAAGVLAVADTAYLAPLHLTADYLNADDDTEAGLPDLLGRSLRTSRRPDALKIAATLRALGREGMAALVERCVEAAEHLAERIGAHPGLRARPGGAGTSTVLFRPAAADALPPEQGDALVADVRRELMRRGRAVLGRAWAEDAPAGAPGGVRKLWLKATLLHPHTAAADFDALLDLSAAPVRPGGAGPACDHGGDV